MAEEKIDESASPKRAGPIGWIIGGVLGIGSGVLAGIGTLNGRLYKNIRDALNPAFDGLKTLGEQAHIVHGERALLGSLPSVSMNNLVNESNAATAMADQHFEYSVHEIIPGADPTAAPKYILDAPLLNDIRNPTTTLGKANEAAEKLTVQRHERLLPDLKKQLETPGKLIQQLEEQQTKGVIDAATFSKGMEQVHNQIADISVSHVAKVKEAAIKDVVKNASFTKKLSLSSDLHLNGKQKAGIAFAAVATTAVVATLSVWAYKKLFGKPKEEQEVSVQRG